MANEEIERGTWFEENKLLGILTMLSRLANYNLDEVEIDEIKHRLTGSNDEKEQWAEYCFNGKDYKMNFKLAYDAEQPDMIHVRVKAREELKDKLEALFFFQDLFKNLDPS